MIPLDLQGDHAQLVEGWLVTLGMILEPREPLHAGVCLVSNDRITCVCMSVLLIANGLVRHCSGDFVVVFQYVEELFMSLKRKKKDL